MPGIRIFLAEDDALLRSVLHQLLVAQSKLEVVGEASSLHAVLRAVPRIKPDVLCLDLFLSDGNSLDLLSELRREAPSTQILVLSGHSDSGFAVRALRSGAHGFLDKTAPPDELFLAIRAVHERRLFIDISADASALMRELANGAPATSADGAEDSLSPREREVLALVAQGHTNQQVADRLFLSVKTIETYRYRINQKCALRDRADLVRCARELGFLEPTTTRPTPGGLRG